MSVEPRLQEVFPRAATDQPDYEQAVEQEGLDQLPAAVMQDGVQVPVPDDEFDGADEMEQVEQAENQFILQIDPALTTERPLTMLLVDSGAYLHVCPP